MVSWNDVWGGVKNVGSTVGEALYEATPIDNFVRVGQAIGRGDWGTALKEGGIGALETALMVVPGVAAGRAAMTAGRLAGRGGFSALARSIPAATRGVLIGNPTAAVRGTGALARGARLAGNLGGSTAGRAAWSGPLLGGIFAGDDTGAQAAVSRGPNFSRGGGRAATTQQVEEGSARRRSTAPAVNQTRRAVPTGPATASTASFANIGQQLAALDPAYQAALDESRSQALLDFQRMQNEADAARRGVSLQTQEALRQAGRGGVTQAADFRQIASELGFGSSPAAYGVGMDEIAAQERAARIAATSQQAAAQEQLARQQLAARRNYESVLNRLDQEELQARGQAGFARLIESLGGR